MDSPGPPFQFRLRTLLLFVAACAGVFALWQSRQRALAVAAVAIGGLVLLANARNIERIGVSVLWCALGAFVGTLLPRGWNSAREAQLMDLMHNEIPCIIVAWCIGCLHNLVRSQDSERS
jgi:hypothetical protein